MQEAAPHGRPAPKVLSSLHPAQRPAIKPAQCVRQGLILMRLIRKAVQIAPQALHRLPGQHLLRPAYSLTIERWSSLHLSLKL